LAAAGHSSDQVNDLYTHVPEVHPVSCSPLGSDVRLLLDLGPSHPGSGRDSGPGRRALAVSVVLTVFIVPAAYYALYRWQEARTSAKNSLANLSKVQAA
jgi:hypothetical protein